MLNIKIRGSKPVQIPTKFYDGKHFSQDPALYEEGSMHIIVHLHVYYHGQYVYAYKYCGGYHVALKWVCLYTEHGFSKQHQLPEARLASMSLLSNNREIINLLRRMCRGTALLSQWNKALLFMWLPAAGEYLLVLSAPDICASRERSCSSGRSVVDTHPPSPRLHQAEGNPAAVLVTLLPVIFCC